jgi:hypothetical protein
VSQLHVVLTAVTALLLLYGTASAESKEFNTGTGDWNIADNWTPSGVPSAGDRANIRDGDVVNVTDSPPATDVTLDGGTINVDGGHLRLGSDGHIELATGTINLSAGSIEQVATWTRTGDRAFGTLIWNQTGGISRINHNAGAPAGNNSTLRLNISGGEYHANGIPLPHPDASEPLLDIDVSGSGFVRLQSIAATNTRISLLNPGAVIAIRTEEWDNFLAAVDTPWKLTDGPEEDFSYAEGTGDGTPPDDGPDNGPDQPVDSRWSWKEKRLPGHGEEPIRARKNIRLGAFIWDFTGWDKEERNQWVGSHFEAFSYDHVGIYYSPADARTLREANPAIFLGIVFSPQILDVKGQSYLNVGGWDPSTMGDWVLKLNDGSEAPNQLWSFEDTHVMDVGNIDYSNYFRDRVALWVERMEANGVFLDGTPWNGAYYPSPSGLRDYDSRDDIEAATRAFIDNLRTVTMVIDDEWKQERQVHLDGLWDEGWMGYDTSIPTWGFDSPTRWEAAVATVERVSSQNKLHLCQGWYHYGNRNELEYLVASYLLGKSSNSALFEPCPIGSPYLPEGAAYDLSCYTADIYAAELEAYPEIFEVELGVATGGRYPVEEHLWARDFAQGRVFVNASLTQTRVVELGEMMRDVDGDALDQVSLEPRSGAILRRPLGTAIVEVVEATPHQSRLGSNYPNPFNGSTILRYQVGESGPVDLVVYDLQGQLVRQLVSRMQRPGSYQIEWDGMDARGAAVASGVYMSRLRIGASFAASSKMLLVE